jgi:electron transport complex protein RnfG
MREAIKLGLFLLITCAIVGLGIAYTNSLTEPIITGAEKSDQEQGLMEVYDNADEIKDETSKYLTVEHEVIKQINTAYKAGEVVGVIYTVEPKGYGGNIRTLVGFDIADNIITNIKVLSHTETAGLGSQAEEPWFAEGFQNKSAAVDLEVVQQAPQRENEIQAITAATVTSKAVATGVNEARNHFQENFQ